jgi:hypothetical protein
MLALLAMAAVGFAESCICCTSLTTTGRHTWHSWRASLLLLHCTRATMCSGTGQAAGSRGCPAATCAARPSSTLQRAALKPGTDAQKPAAVWRSHTVSDRYPSTSQRCPGVAHAVSVAAYLLAHLLPHLCRPVAAHPGPALAAPALARSAAAGGRPSAALRAAGRLHQTGEQRDITFSCIPWLQMACVTALAHLHSRAPPKTAPCWQMAAIGIRRCSSLSCASQAAPAGRPSASHIAAANGPAASQQPPAPVQLRDRTSHNKRVPALQAGLQWLAR